MTEAGRIVPDTMRGRKLLEGLYDALRRREIDAAPAGLTAAAIDPHRADGFRRGGRLVSVHQVVRDLGGTILGQSVVTHTYRFDAEGDACRSGVATAPGRAGSGTPLPA